MSVVSLFVQSAPTMAGYSFDAVLEDTLDISVEWTSYPVESGVNINDHRIIRPTRWTLTGAVSNNPLQVQATDFLGGALSNLSSNPLVATVAGMSAGFLAGSNSTKTSSTLEMLIRLMRIGEPFSVDTVDLQLQNMVISRIGRNKTPENEQGGIFVVELQELITVDRLLSDSEPSISQTRTGDVSQTGIAGVVKRGEQSLKDVGAKINSSVNDVLAGIF